MNVRTLYDIVRLHRDRAWDRQVSIVPGDPDWEPEGADDGPIGDVARFWYETGKAEAFAAIMSEIENSTESVLS